MAQGLDVLSTVYTDQEAGTDDDQEENSSQVQGGFQTRGVDRRREYREQR